MSKSLEEILGGYATDTLTEDEKRQLCEAALTDQALFDALADEEALKALLADQEVRQRVLASLEASGDLQETAVSSSAQKVSWLRQPSSLAWVGSIAAMGLALIFGWQMNNDWGPIVKQEEKKAHSIIADKDDEKSEETFRSQQPVRGQSEQRSQASQKLVEETSEKVEHVSDSVLSSVKAKALKPSGPMVPSSAEIPSKDTVQQELKRKPQFQPSESMPRTHESSVAQQIPEDEPSGAPSVALSETVKEDFQPLAQIPNFSDAIQEEDAQPSRSANELVLESKRKRVDSVDGDSDRVDVLQGLESVSGKEENALAKERADGQYSEEIVQQYIERESKGIRYHFIRRVFDGKDQAIDITQFSGNWSELSLSIESNISGYLYVLTAYGKRKWQWMRSDSPNLQRASDGAIVMDAKQPVNFALSQVTNTVGNPVVSSISVILSFAPLEDLGQWLGDTRAIADVQVESMGDHVFALQSSIGSDLPLRVEIPLEK